MNEHLVAAVVQEKAEEGTAFFRYAVIDLKNETVMPYGSEAGLPPETEDRLVDDLFFRKYVYFRPSSTKSSTSDLVANLVRTMACGR